MPSILYSDSSTKPQLKLTRQIKCKEGAIHAKNPLLGLINYSSVVTHSCGMSGWTKKMKSGTDAFQSQAKLYKRLRDAMQNRTLRCSEA